MTDIAEKRVHDDDAGTTEVVIAAGIGVVSVSASSGRIGRFGVVHRCSPRAVAAGGDLLAVATTEDVLCRRTDAFVPTGFGPAVAVGVHEGAVLAADDGGRIARREVDGDGWTAVGTVDASVRAIDGPLLATDAGVYRVRTDDAAIDAAGLESANDVAAGGPFVATDAGLYVLGNGWMEVLAGRFDAVAATTRERACAAGSEGDDASAGAFVREGGEWRSVDLPTDQVVADVAMADRAYAITEAGTLLAGPEWRSRSLGVDGVVGMATPSPS
jgi:hypothetical protein